MHLNNLPNNKIFLLKFYLKRFKRITVFIKNSQCYLSDTLSSLSNNSNRLPIVSGNSMNND